VEVPEEYQGFGIGTKMIERAIKEYGQVYFSNADRLDFNTKFPEHGYDSRYLTEDGQKFINSLIMRNIIPKDWLRFPEI
jgi:GNAT superfamily N-acetyltransferase